MGKNCKHISLLHQRLSNHVSWAFARCVTRNVAIRDAVH